MELEEKVRNFWHWFEVNRKEINPNIITEEMIDILDLKILELGDFAWEIREGKAKDNMLIISPGGDVELLKITEKIINSAMNISDWEFKSFKPPKNWNFRFKLEETVEIDASNWEYILIKFTDGTFDILIKAENLKSLKETDRNLAVDIVLESTIGEKNYIEKIINYELVDSFDIKYQGKQNKIKVLSNHLTQLLE